MNSSQDKRQELPGHFQNNRSVWDTHYQRSRSRQGVPDENVVRYLHKTIPALSQSQRPLVLDLGTGSGRNLNYIRTFEVEAYGCDFAIEALRGQEGIFCCDLRRLPFGEGVFDLVIIWGVLHYLPLDEIPAALDEICRILKKGGRVFGTLRSSEDTHLNKALKEGDLQGGGAHLFSHREAQELLSRFENRRFGFISRIPLGEERVIAHHIFEGQK